VTKKPFGKELAKTVKSPRHFEPPGERPKKKKKKTTRGAEKKSSKVDEKAGGNERLARGTVRSEEGERAKTVSRAKMRKKKGDLNRGRKKKGRYQVHEQTKEKEELRSEKPGLVVGKKTRPSEKNIILSDERGKNGGERNGGKEASSCWERDWPRR